ncbi:unnamed protein product, partial [Lampetra planeri]
AKALSSVLGNNNLQFSGMNITLTVSTSCLTLTTPDTKQIIASHHMQVHLLRVRRGPGHDRLCGLRGKGSCEPETCHIVECGDGLAQDVISTIGQAFELRFKQYLKNPPKLIAPHDRMLSLEGSAWDEEEEEEEMDEVEEEAEEEKHQYYNHVPGKQLPPGGRTQVGRREGRGGRAPHSLRVPGCARGGFTTPAKDEHQWRDHGLMSRMPSVPPCHGGVGGGVRLAGGDVAGWVGGRVSGGGRGSLPPSPTGAPPRPPAPPPRPLPPPATAAASMEEALRRERWYHGKMSRHDAEQLLQEDGDFLVRESMTSRGQYVLTGLQQQHGKHLLLVDPHGVVRTKDRRFDSVSHLIGYHRDNQLPIISAGSELSLKQPVERQT